MRKTKALLVVGSSVFFSLCTVASAQTSDGQPPSQESVCDVVKGGTPALYGLCVAYCEALDCTDTVINAHPAKQCKNPPSTKILENYRRKMQAGDPDMPCVVGDPGQCPCWTASELASIQPYFGICQNNLDLTNTTMDTGTGINARSDAASYPNGFAVVYTRAVRGEAYCAYGSAGGVTIRFQLVDNTQAAACSLAIQTYATSNGGWSCFAP